MSEIGWHHPVDDADQWDGFNQPGIEHFRGNPVPYLAREVHQNSMDAAEEGQEVFVQIRLHQVDTLSLPNLDELRTNIEACMPGATIEGDKATHFFAKAKKELRRKKISVLEISDYNTRGMKGPATNGTPFFAFMKAEGQSIKNDPTATGSYGIGKFAPYAVSNLRTVFVSTVFQDDQGDYQQLTQAKSVFMSHDVDEERLRGVGYWGVKEKCRPLKGVSEELPDWVQRVNSEEELPKNKGTKLSILCFDKVSNWQAILAASVAENFFGAIMSGHLRVDIDDGKFLLSKDTLKDFFQDNEVRESVVCLKNEPEQFDNCYQYLRALSDDDTEVIIEESQQTHLGLCQVRILIGEGLPKKVCALRNGMFITSRLNGLKIFSDFKEFVAVFSCQNKDGNKLLRAMEPPRHDDFEPERLTTKKDQAKGNKALAGVAKWIRDMLKRHAKDPVSDVTVLDELKEFFGDEGDDDSGSGADEINPYGKVVIRAKPIKVTAKSSALPGDQGNSNNGNGSGVGDGDGGDGGGGDTGTGGGDGQGGQGSGQGGQGGSGNNSGIASELFNIRALQKGGNARKIWFTPTKTGKLRIKMLEAGADTDYPLPMESVSSGELSDGCVEIEVQKEQRVELDVEFIEDFNGAIKVVANEV